MNSTFKITKDLEADINSILSSFHGKKLVQLYSDLTFEGPKIINKILIDLSNLLKTDGYKSIKEAIGKDT